LIQLNAFEAKPRFYVFLSFIRHLERENLFSLIVSLIAMRIRGPPLVIYSVITQECVHLIYNSLAYLILKKNFSITTLQSEKVRDTQQFHYFFKGLDSF